MSVEAALKILETPEAEGGLQDHEKIISALAVLRSVEPVVVPTAAPVESSSAPVPVAAVESTPAPKVAPVVESVSAPIESAPLPEVVVVEAPVSEVAVVESSAALAPIVILVSPAVDVLLQ